MFLKNLIKKAKTAVDTTEEIDNHFFAQVMEEIEKGFRDKGLHGKAIALSGGDDAKANAIYVELRAKALQEKYIESQTAEHDQNANEDSPATDVGSNTLAYRIKMIFFTVIATIIATIIAIIIISLIVVGIGKII